MNTLFIHLNRTSPFSALMSQQERKTRPEGRLFIFPLVTADGYTVSDKPLKLFPQSEGPRLSHGKRIKSEAMGGEVLIKVTSAADRAPVPPPRSLACKPALLSAPVKTGNPYLAHTQHDLKQVKIISRVRSCLPRGVPRLVQVLQQGRR